MTDTADNLVWVDLETTGLDPENGVPLEIAVIVTDPDLKELEVVEAVISQNIYLNALDPWIVNTHTQNGLLAEVVSPESRESAAIDRELERLLLRSDLWPNAQWKPPLCGSSIAFERAWLKVHFPKFFARLSYRSIDVSSIKELMKRWRPEEAIDTKEKSTHRALPDIRASINELQFYRNNLDWFPYR